MKERSFKKVYITKKGEKQIELGHPWIYEGEIIKSDSSINNGDIVDVTNEKEKYLGSGFYNSNSKIIVRLISRNANDTFDGIELVLSCIDVKEEKKKKLEDLIETIKKYCEEKIKVKVTVCDEKEIIYNVFNYMNLFYKN